MPFTLQSSGDKKAVLSQVNGQITASYDQAPKGQDREDNKKSLEKVRDYLFNDLGGDFPDESPVGLVLVGDAGKDYISITRMEFSISRPPKSVEETPLSAPDKKPVEASSTLTASPAPDKKEVTSAPSQPEKVSGTEANPTIASPHFENTGMANPTVPGADTSGGKF